ncbi:hypothetical protein BD324DRAFT_357063 [Kockovaella imperatae]|uniref:MYND-type domain-containing protein n=1 Tax=Kockovaella imperatae TaxID=4999 RepID=A0A1Y1ULQ2_9TREE|nr:hypothetical protein BD324DRAFT_357063 [Kockovaella imperatae]ORX38434.1 hypothetical protein BD324DRAFT_357063 [Kockovaella imperatae]
MRESNYSFPPHNRAVLSITHLLYDRRALDTNSPLAILNNLTSLTYLTSTSPRIRDILTLDGGLERLLDILRNSCLPREAQRGQDLWGLNGPPTSRVISVDRQVFLRHSLAFQCVVNIGVRGSEAIRTRVVQAGALDLVAQILESWLVYHGIGTFAGPTGSQMAITALKAGIPVPGTEGQRRMTRFSNSRFAQAVSTTAARSTSSISSFVGSLTGRNNPRESAAPDPTPEYRAASVEPARTNDTDVDMADGEADEGTDIASVDPGDDSMEIDDGSREEETPEARAGPSMTPRPPVSLAPSYGTSSRSTSRDRHVESQASSITNSVSGDELSGRIPRATSENNLGAAVASGSTARPPHLNLGGTRLPALGQDSISNQSSPMGTPIRQDDGEILRAPGRRGTIVGRPVNVTLAPRNERRREAGDGGSGTSDVGEDVDLPTATIAAGIAAANAQAMESGGTVVPDEPGPPPNVEIVENLASAVPEDPDPEMVEAEQARLDMEAGAPPGQPGAAQTPRVPPAENAAPQQAPDAAVPPGQIIIANGAPRGFHDLGSYVGISSLLNPDGDRYSDDSILLALQLLAYLSKYPHVRSAFHHPRRPMHPTFDLSPAPNSQPLPQRPATSLTPNMFSLVERFTFRPTPSDPLLYVIPDEIQYWAGVIMRNACRKDEARNGIRQCAHMPCGKWEEYAREFAKCRRCRKAKYCSKECQSKAWSEGHRFWCNTRSDEPPPGVAAATGQGQTGQDHINPNTHGAEPDDDDLDAEFAHADLPGHLVARVRAAREGDRRGPGGAVGGGGRIGGGTIDPNVTAVELPIDFQQNLLQEALGTRTAPMGQGVPAPLRRPPTQPQARDARVPMPIPLRPAQPPPAPGTARGTESYVRPPTALRAAPPSDPSARTRPRGRPGDGTQP